MKPIQSLKLQYSDSLRTHWVLRLKQLGSNKAFCLLSNQNTVYTNSYTFSGKHTFAILWLNVNLICASLNSSRVYLPSRNAFLSSSNAFLSLGNRFLNPDIDDLASDFHYPASNNGYLTSDFQFLNPESDSPASNSHSPASNNGFLTSEVLFLNPESDFLNPNRHFLTIDLDFLNQQSPCAATNKVI